MQRLQLRVPYVILADAAKLADAYGRTDAHILRRALKIGIVELREDARKPVKEKEQEND